MQCVSTVSYSILINGEVTKNLKPSCGIRQEDPLSPYLFILIMEALSRLISEAEKNNGRISGLQISRRSPSISYLFFADHFLLFYKANPQSCVAVKHLIRKFCKYSGDVINFAKSFVMFIPNTPQKFKRFMRSLIGTLFADDFGKYLGVDVEINGRSSSKFQPLLEKIERKIEECQNLTLSHAGKILLVNATLVSLCQHIQSILILNSKENCG